MLDVITLFFSQITKAEADQCKPELDIPGCSLKLWWTEEGELRPFFHRVTLQGAQPPKDFFYICYFPGVAGEGLQGYQF